LFLRNGLKDSRLIGSDPHVLAIGLPVFVMGTSARPNEPVLYAYDVPVFVLSVGDIRNQNSPLGRNPELEALILGPEFVASGLFTRCDTVFCRRVVG
jgi:hypothetical protein